MGQCLSSESREQTYAPSSALPETTPTNITATKTTTTPSPTAATPPTSALPPTKVASQGAEEFNALVQTKRQEQAKAAIASFHNTQHKHAQKMQPIEKLLSDIHLTGMLGAGGFGAVLSGGAEHEQVGIHASCACSSHHVEV